MSGTAQALFSLHDEVRLLSSPDRAGKVVSAGSRIQGEYWYAISFGPGQTERHPESDLERYALSTDVLSILQDQRYAGRDAFARRLTYLKLARSLRSHVYALQAARTTFYAYQFKPVLKYLDSDRHRLLVADEVGLGKTIEAGLVLTELRARVTLNRVLIVAPSHLLGKWQEEMRRRFALDFDILTRARAMEFLTNFERDGEEARLFGIMSLQTLRSRSMQERWAAALPTFDLAIFDEAGRLRNEGTLSHEAAAMVGESSDALLLLTATPVQTGERDLFSLLHLLDPDDFSDFGAYQERLAANRYVLDAVRLVRGGIDRFPDAITNLKALALTSYGRRLASNPVYTDLIGRLEDSEAASRRDLIEIQRDLNALDLFGHVLSRTRRREVHEYRALREARTVYADAHPAEQQFYRTVTALCRRAMGATRNEGFAAFVTMMPQRQMASCMPAMVSYVKDRRARGDWEVSAAETSDLLFDDMFEEEPELRDPLLDWSALGDLDVLEQRLEQVDSKFASLLRVLRTELDAPNPAKIVVFSFFKRTLSYLQRRLNAEGIASVLISGDVKSAPDEPELDERGRRLRQFKTDPAMNVLLSTEVGNEGLDMQFAHVLVNYDLPWNPMVVEQRIGRLDRIGQKSPVIRIFNLSTPGTIEDRILVRLYERVKIFQNSIGDLEDILGQVVKELSVDLLSRELTEEQVAARIEQAAEAVERQRLAQQELEARVSSLIGNDEFFRDEIDRARDGRRFVTGEELLAFVKDYLREHEPRLLVEEVEPGIWSVPVSDSLRWMVRKRLGQEDPRWFQFQRRTASGRLRFTVDTDIAQERHEIDLLAFHHPFIAAIAAHYAENASELHPVSWIQLRSDELPSGKYLWVLYLTEVTGARPSKELEFVAAPVIGGEVLSVDEADSLLQALISQGTSTLDPRPWVDLPGGFIARLDETAVARLNRRFSEQRTLNDALVDARLASLESAHSRNLATRRERLDLARSRGRAPQYLRMLEGGIRKLEEKFAIRRRELNELRRMGRSWNVEAAGIVEVARA